MKNILPSITICLLSSMALAVPNSVSLTALIGDPNQLLENLSMANATIPTGTPTMLGISTSRQTLNVGQCSKNVIVRALSAPGKVIKVASAVTVNLTGAPQAQFFSDSACTQQVYRHRNKNGNLGPQDEGALWLQRSSVTII